MARGRQYGTVPPWSNQEEEKEEASTKIVNRHREEIPTLAHFNLCLSYYSVKEFSVRQQSK